MGGYDWLLVNRCHKKFSIYANGPRKPREGRLLFSI
jgi:hypothetical protein